ncbi:YceD family protein [Parasphingorhabdus cellanae]|uniref:DUF177 domain-containing protein n=1 Tax=Parasphingorhabdus cellanae TaxID=2806553 RepID=A0ABX7T7B0_9SPHN|nr:DUF177 domain-containing protein [Parasphingorhabdus cellanae]QTD57503.1 DUF177 domain-containing protein [Parasphingorhabdus cellanae]
MTASSPLPQPELSKIIKLSEIGSSALTGTIVADDEERQALAKRFDLPSIESITSEYRLAAKEHEISFTGTIQSSLHQACAISGQPFPVQIDEIFNIIFVEKTEIPASDEEIELAPEDCDVIEYDAAQIDLGEAIAQTLYLALDPYPRGPDADRAAEKNGLKSEEEAGPFGALAALKDKLG